MPCRPNPFRRCHLDRSLPLAALAAAAIVCAIAGPRLGSPDPAVMAAILLSSLASSLVGFAFSAICGAILFHLLDDHVQVVQVMITCSIANQATMVCALRRDVDWRSLSPFLLGGALGLPLGVWALLHTDRRSYTEALGLFFLAYSLYLLVGQRSVLRWTHPALDAAVGLIGGITGGAAALPGAPVTVYCALQGWDKVRQRALYQPFILAMQVAALLLISVFNRPGAHGIGFAPGNLLCVPAGLLGTAIGMAWFRRMSNRQFGVAVNLLLLVSGLSLVL
jgi:uncharacterized membrane protein YfcA